MRQPRACSRTRAVAPTGELQCRRPFRSIVLDRGRLDQCRGFARRGRRERARCGSWRTGRRRAAAARAALGLRARQSLRQPAACGLACPPAVVHQLSLLAGVAVIDAIGRPPPARRIAGLRLKWPNDVLIGEAKCAGILPESHIGRRRGGASLAVIGIGINLASHPDGPRARRDPSCRARGERWRRRRCWAILPSAMQRWLGVWDCGYRLCRTCARRGSSAAAPSARTLTVDTGREAHRRHIPRSRRRRRAHHARWQGRERKLTFGDVTLAAAGRKRIA